MRNLQNHISFIPFQVLFRQKTTAQSQRDEFASQLSQQDFPKVKAQDWNDLFWLLADKVKKGKVVILLDEISWMGDKDPDFGQTQKCLGAAF